MSDIADVFDDVYQGGGEAPAGALASLEATLGRTLPGDYVRLMRHANGGGLDLGSSLMELWRVEDVGPFNEAYEIQRWLPGLIAIGSDGGGKCFAFDYRAEPQRPPLVRVPFGDLAPESVVVVGDTLTDAIQRLRRGEID